MIQASIHFDTPAGNLFARIFAPEASSRAAICLIHGMGEHSGRYIALAESLTSQGIGVLALDLPGHGHSPGKKGAFPVEEKMLDLIEAALQETSTKFGNVPLFLMGHSLGGNLVANFALKRDTSAIKGVILSSPYFGLAFEPSGIDILLGKIMAVIWPGFSLKTNLDTKAISRIPAEVQAYEMDDLVHDRITARTFQIAQNGATYAREHAADWKLPLLAVHGSDDGLTKYAFTESFTQEANGDITWHPFPGGYHELHHDLDRGVLLSLYASWISDRLA